MWQPYNPNPMGLSVGDCVIRAISKAEDKSWEEAFLAITTEGFKLADMPSANRVWGSYLQEHGFERCWLPNECSTCYTVKQFAEDNPKGTFVLALDGHVVCLKDACWYDSWDSCDRVVLYFFKRSDE